MAPGPEGAPRPAGSGSNRGPQPHPAEGSPTAFQPLTELLTFFRGFGPGGEVAFLFVILCLDAMLVPTLPELFVMGFYMENPTAEWGVLLLGVVVVAELTGNGFLFLYVRRFHLPKIFEKAMKRWVSFLMVHDERIILVNRVAPILPFVGAFIATMKWKPRRAFFYVFIGGAVKYAVLIAAVGVLYTLFDGNTARNATVSLIGAIIIVSFAQSHFAKKRHLGPVAARVAHISEKSVEVAPPAAPKGNEDGAHGGGD